MQGNKKILQNQQKHVNTLFNKEGYRVTKRIDDPEKGMKIQFHLSPGETKLFKELMRKGGGGATKAFFLDLMAERALVYEEIKNGRQIGAFSEDLKTIRVFIIPYFPE